MEQHQPVHFLGCCFPVSSATVSPGDSSAPPDCSDYCNSANRNRQLSEPGPAHQPTPDDLSGSAASVWPLQSAGRPCAVDRAPAAVAIRPANRIPDLL